MKKLIFLMLIGANVLIAQEKTMLTALEVASIKTVARSIINDDGSKIAYLVSQPADPTKENKGKSYQLFLMDVKSGESTPFVTQGLIYNVQFRPTRKSLTFISKREDDKHSSLYEIPLTGGEAQKLLDFETSISSYDWSVDGKRVVFTAIEEKEEKKSSLPYEPIVYEENLTYTKAYVVEVGNGEPKKVPIEGNIHSIKWGPKGEKLAFSVAPTPLVDDKYMKQMIYVINSADFAVVKEIPIHAKFGSLDWNPNGKELALLVGADINDPTPARLLIADINTGTTKYLLPNFLGGFDFISWVDEKNIQFIASEGVYASIGTINVANNAMEKIIDKRNYDFYSLSRAKNGDITLIGNTAEYPSELHLLKKGTKELKRITHSNPWLDEKELGKQEVVTYKAKDGLEIQGLLIHPLNEQKNTKYPLITVVHGGPESHYNNGWLTSYANPGQMVAIDGYAVFYPNYRGSTGRGVDFAKTSQGDPAGKEFDDIIDGIDYLISTGLVDKDKVGVTGGSYGGYATGWLTTRYTERFAAGVMFVGIGNVLSGWGTGDIPNEHYYVHFRKHIWEDYDFFLKRSPIYYAGQAKTPLLIMAGKDDTRVDPGQSYELYRHIKTRTETPVRLVLFPGEGHGNSKATACFDYNLRMLRWFDTYLKNKSETMPNSEIHFELDDNK